MKNRGVEFRIILSVCHRGSEITSYAREESSTAWKFCERKLRKERIGFARIRKNCFVTRYTSKTLQQILHDVNDNSTSSERGPVNTRDDLFSLRVPGHVWPNFAGNKRRKGSRSDVPGVLQSKLHGTRSVVFRGTIFDQEQG